MQNEIISKLWLFLGAIAKGKEGKPDATFTMLDDDFLELAAGKLNPQNAFMTVSRSILIA